MKKIQMISACLLLGGLLLSCSSEVLSDGESVVPGKMVDCKLQLSVAGMQTITPPATRVADSESVIDVDYGSMESTRASGALSSAESEIKSLYVVQFDFASKKLLAVSGNVVGSYDAATKQVNVSMSTNSGKTQTIFLIANRNLASGLTVGTTTLNEFQTFLYPAPLSTGGLSQYPSGLPMSSLQNAVVVTSTYLKEFVLRPLLAKLNVKFNVASSLNMKNFSYSIYGYDEAPLTTYRNAELGRSSNSLKQLYSSGPNAECGVVHSHYLAPSIALDNSSITAPSQRGVVNAPPDAAYIEITGEINGQAVGFVFYLGNGVSSNFTLGGGFCYNLSIAIKGINETDLRVGIGTDFTKKEPANCYIVSKTGGSFYYLFDCTVMGNGIDRSTELSDPVLKPSTLAPKSVKVLWETGTVAGAVVKKAALFDNGRKVKFWSGGTEGNAVIAVYASADGTGPALWSWHIWCTKGTYGAIPLADIVATRGTFSPSGKTTSTALDIMNCNLGALNATPESDGSIGLLYQWGRKDPFPGQRSLNDPSSPLGMPTTLDPEGSERYPHGTYSSMNLVEAIEDPGTLVWDTFDESEKSVGWDYDNTGDWTGSQNDNLWGTPNTGMVTIGDGQYNGNYGVKTIYDPCPSGMRVPPAYIFANSKKASYSGSKGTFYSGANAFTLFEDAWFPSAGLRISGHLERLSQSYLTASPHYLKYYNEQKGEDQDYSCLAFMWTFNSPPSGTEYNYVPRGSACPVRCMYDE